MFIQLFDLLAYDIYLSLNFLLGADKSFYNLYLIYVQYNLCSL